MIADDDPRVVLDAAKGLDQVIVHGRAGQLVAQDLGFSDLVDGAGHSRSHELLETTDLQIGEISHKLGYANSSAFVHAFRRWYRTSPGRWRGHATRTPPQ